jgi:hypothetical protein
MAAAVATAMALPGRLGSGSAMHRVLTAPASSLQRIIHVNVTPAGRKAAANERSQHVALGGRSSALAGRAVQPLGSRVTGITRQRNGKSSRAAAVPTRKPAPAPSRPSAPVPAPAPSAPVTQPVATAPAVSEPSRELAASPPAPAPATPTATATAKSQRRDGQSAAVAPPADDNAGEGEPATQPGADGSGCGGDHGDSGRNNGDRGSGRDNDRRGGHDGEGRGHDD